MYYTFHKVVFFSESLLYTFKPNKNLLDNKTRNTQHWKYPTIVTEWTEFTVVFCSKYPTSNLLIAWTDVPIFHVHDLFLLSFLLFPCELTIIDGMKSFVLFCSFVPLVSSYTQNVCADRQTDQRTIANPNPPSIKQLKTETNQTNKNTFYNRSCVC